MTDLLIIGAGLSGLSAAYHACSAGIEHEIYEKEEKPGGLCRTIKKGEFLFDYSGHLIHLKSEYFKDLVKDLLGENLQIIERNAFIYSHGVFTRYPFQMNLYGLPPVVIKECLLGFINASTGNNDLPSCAFTNFREWIIGKLGEGIGRHFMFPYNEKLWTVPAEELTCEWLSEYVPRPTLEQVFEGTFADNRERIGYNATFWYPKMGGIQSLCDSIASRLHDIRLNEKAIRIRVKDKVVEFESGRSTKYSVLISTMPLDQLVDILDSAVPGKVRESAACLRHNSVLILNLGVRRNTSNDMHWVYLPEKRYKAYRVGVYSNISRGIAPTEMGSFYVEIAYRKGMSFNKEIAVEESIANLIAMGFLRSKDDVVIKEVFDVDHAYVIYDAQWTRCRKTIMDYLNENSIFSIGRYGNWEYSGMEEAIQQGKEVVAGLWPRISERKHAKKKQ